MHRSEWQVHVTAFEESGLSASAYAKRHELVYHQFLYWWRKLAHTQETDDGFVPVNVNAEQCTATIKMRTERQSS